MDSNAIGLPKTQQFVIKSDLTEPSAGFATSSDPNAILQCTLSAPCAQHLSVLFNTSNQQITSLGDPNILWLTNSTDNPDEPNALTISNLCSSTNSEITVTDEDGSQYLFSETGTSNPCLSSPATPAAGSYSLSTGETGSYTIYVFPDPSGTYAGTFDDTGSSGNNHHRTGNSGTDTISLEVNSDSSVSETMRVIGGELCSEQTSSLVLSSAAPLAISNGVDPTDGISSVSVGDAVLLSLGDANGNVVWLVMTDQDANGNPLPDGSLYVTGFSPNGICGGIYFYDRPFDGDTVRGNVPRTRHHDPIYLGKPLSTWKKRIENRQRLLARTDIPIVGW